MNAKINRIIDANYNRAKEGLRVCEDIARFILSDKKLTMDFKEIRHSVTTGLKILNVDEKDLIESRSTLKDVGKETTLSEINKENIEHIFFANLQRVKEAMRVLEESSKIINRKASQKFKEIRYKTYELEKTISKKISFISDNG